MNKNWPIILEEDKERVLQVLDNGNLWRGDGKFLFELEKKFSQLHQSRYALATTNGTHSLEIALAACGVGFGDEVIIPAYTFIATASAIIMRNAIPVPIEVEPATFCIDVQKIEEKITNRTKAIIPVHIAGHACDMDTIMQIADKYDLFIIEDAAHSHGSYYKERPLGSIGHFGTFSFQGIKTMTAGEGGMLITNNEKLYHRAYSFFNCGRSVGGDPYNHLTLSSNYRMSELQAALLISQCDRLHYQIGQRERAVKMLNDFLNEIAIIKPQTRRNYASVQGYSMYMFSIELNQELINSVLHKLNAIGYPIRRTYPEFYKTTMFNRLYDENPHYLLMENRIDYADLKFTNSEYISNHVLWLPHYFLLSEEKILRNFKEDILSILKEEGVLSECLID